jgi:hypothetical protein
LTKDDDRHTKISGVSINIMTPKYNNSFYFSVLFVLLVQAGLQQQLVEGQDELDRAVDKELEAGEGQSKKNKWGRSKNIFGFFAICLPYIL